jgi:thioredoxin
LTDKLSLLTGKIFNMKRKLLLSLLISSLFFINCRSEKGNKSEANTPGAENVIHLTTAEFKKMVFNYEVNKDWKYEGTQPAIIDFYADWCAPCRQLAPLLEEVAKEYNGKVIVYKVDTEKERELTQNMNISGLPTLLFIPAQGKPQMSMGLIPKESLVKAINEVLLIK